MPLSSIWQLLPCFSYLGRCAGLLSDESWLDRAKLLFCILIGVAITFLVSTTVFPQRARQLLQRSFATSLERMANVSFDILGELCQVCTRCSGGEGPVVQMRCSCSTTSALPVRLMQRRLTSLSA